jgi:hypothetical protein
MFNHDCSDTHEVADIRLCVDLSSITTMGNAGGLKCLQE